MPDCNEQGLKTKPVPGQISFQHCDTKLTPIH